jgi:hypothetical protein
MFSFARAAAKVRDHALPAARAQRGISVCA